MTEHTCTSPDTKFWPATGYPRHWTARVFCMPSVSCTRTWFARRRPARIEFATFWSGVKSATRCFSCKEIWKRSCPLPMLEINNLPRQIFISPPPSGFNGRPLWTLYIGALVVERSFAELGILHHPLPCIWDDIFITPFTVKWKW